MRKQNETDSLVASRYRMRVCNNLFYVWSDAIMNENYPCVKQVILSHITKGKGTLSDPMRKLLQVHTLDGELLAEENDPHIVTLANCDHRKTRISEPHLAGARSCNDCGMYYNPNMGGWVDASKGKGF